MSEQACKPAIIMTTRVPVDAACKTRLSPLLSSEERCRLQTAMIQDELESIAQTGLPCLCFVTPSEAQDRMEDVIGSEIPIFPQSGNDLGEMMRNAFAEAFAQGYSPCILIGSDIPELSPEDFRAALLALEENDVVLSPTVDGGYCLIGMNRLLEEAFKVEGYGSSSALEATLGSLENAGASVALLPEKHDIDTPDDLMQLLEHGSARLALRTLEAATDVLQDKTLPSVSIVIPAYNEQATLPRLFAQLEPLRNDCQIIFVDGGSSDETSQLIEDAGYPCLNGKGRGNQLNVGAKKATGDVLFFLHCDSIIPENPLEQMREVLENDRAGFFGIRFDSNDWVMGVCGRQSNRRAKYRQIPFGDQGIFLWRDLFWEMGGFPEIPLMEDYEFSMRLREQGIHFGQTREPIVTSARRYGKGFFHQLKVMYQMHELRFRYRHGCPPEELRERYKKVK